MKISSNMLVGLVGGLIILLGIYWFYSNIRDTAEEAISVNSYEECVEAGYPILDAYPEQCVTPGGISFTRVISDMELSVEVRDHIAAKTSLIVVSQPKPLEEVSSPLVIEGAARGNWYFEGDFPIRIEDENGVVLGEHYATADGDWMTNEFVPFKSELTFREPDTDRGVLVLEKDNPSGLAENADELRIPVRFGVSTIVQEDQTVQLFYYNPSLDEGRDGTVMCSAAGLVTVDRPIPDSPSPIQDTIRMLIQGELTQEEQARGITTEFPLEGLELEGAALNNGVLTLEFSDPNNVTSGGACRTGILWLQIERTAEQFDAVDEVRFQPEELFQP